MFYHEGTNQDNSVQAEATYTPVAFRLGDSMYVQEGAALPTGICIRSGKKASRTRVVSLRNPKNPMTWVGKTKKITVGLTKKQADNTSVAIALTYSLLVIGLLLLITGILTMGISAILIGLFAVAISGLFRSGFPVWSPDPKAEPVQILGASEDFIDLLPEGVLEEEVEPVPESEVPGEQQLLY